MMEDPLLFNRLRILKKKKSAHVENKFYFVNLLLRFVEDFSQAMGSNFI